MEKIFKILSGIIVIIFFNLLIGANVFAEESWLWPVPDTIDTNGGRGYMENVHDGLDILAYQGAPIVASKSGTVYMVLQNGMDYSQHHGYGNGVIIYTDDGYYIHYAHLYSVSVTQGSRVSRGQQIGSMGTTGNSTGVHLHFSIAKGKKAMTGVGDRINNNVGVIFYSHDYSNLSGTYGFDFPKEGQIISEDVFLFQGWVKSEKPITDIQCSINDGVSYHKANLYTRTDVPEAIAFRLEIPSTTLNFGSNYVAVCVDYSDGTAETIIKRQVIKNNGVDTSTLNGFDYPEYNLNITSSTFLFQGWVKGNKNITNIQCSINDGESYHKATLYTRDDVPDSTAFRVEICSDKLHYGSNIVSVCVDYADGTAETVARRPVNKVFEEYIDYPSNKNYLETEKYLLMQGWGYYHNKQISNYAIDINGENVVSVEPYIRSDLMEGARAFRYECPYSVLENGNNRVDFMVYYADGSSRLMASREFTFTHNIVTDNAFNPTCDRLGKTEGSHCDKCDKIFVKQQDIAILRHDWNVGKITKEPTETEKGVKTYTCSGCGATRVEYIPAKGKAEEQMDKPMQTVAIPAKPKISNIKNIKGKKLTLKWEKVKKALGYEVQYSLNKKFTKSLRTKTVKKSSLTVKKLKYKKTYYVRVRAYVKDSSGKKVYSAWSKVKKVKIKK